MLANTLLLMASSLATAAVGAALPGAASANTNTSANEAITMVDLVPDVGAADGVSRAPLQSRTDDPRVWLTSFPEHQCRGLPAPLVGPDGVCARLHGRSLVIRDVAATCRVFAYAKSDCTGAEFLAEIGYCYDVGSYNGLKVFCG